MSTNSSCALVLKGAFIATLLWSNSSSLPCPTPFLWCILPELKESLRCFSCTLPFYHQFSILAWKSVCIQPFLCVTDQWSTDFHQASLTTHHICSPSWRKTKVRYHTWAVQNGARHPSSGGWRMKKGGHSLSLHFHLLPLESFLFHCQMFGLGIGTRFQIPIKTNWVIIDHSLSSQSDIFLMIVMKVKWLEESNACHP